MLQVIKPTFWLLACVLVIVCRSCSGTSSTSVEGKIYDPGPNYFRIARALLTLDNGQFGNDDNDDDGDNNDGVNDNIDDTEDGWQFNRLHLKGKFDFALLDAL